MAKEYIIRDEMIEQAKAQIVLGAPRFNTGLKAAIEVATSLPAADVVSKEQYDQLLRAARRMHEWIFLNSCDELEAYRECGLTDEDNDLLGYIGQMQVEVQLEAKTCEEAEAALKGGQDDV